MKRVLVLCTGNSCRSIIAQALIDRYLDGVEACSAGVAPSGRVHPNAIKVLQDHGCWSDDYRSKHLDSVIDREFDLVVTVCDHAKESCPIFPSPIPKVHIGFEDPDGKEYEAFVETYEQIENILLPRVRAILNGVVDELSSDDYICYCIGVAKGEIVDAIRDGADTLAKVRETTKACTGSSCKTTNPLKRCCAKEIKTLIEREHKPMQKSPFRTANSDNSLLGAVVAKPKTADGDRS